MHDPMIAEQGARIMTWRLVVECVSVCGLITEETAMAEATQATLDDWKARAAKARIPTEAIIDGKASAAASGQTFDCVSPIDGKLLGRIAAGDAADVDRAVRAARASFDAGV
jgi:hypothetical protein